ncbi:MAG: hypothetical protein ACI4C4_07010 [Lachnospiraceae bacterium]
MVENIFVAFLCVVVAVAGIWCWWYETGGTQKKDRKKDEKIVQADEGNCKK